MPAFRIGANTGPALVGNIGSEQLRGFNAMGDAVNVAARLQTLGALRKAGWIRTSRLSIAVHDLDALRKRSL